MDRSGSAELFPEGRCFICFKELGQGVANVRSKGLNTLIECSEKRGEDILQTFLQSRLNGPGVVKIRMHEVCRNEYTLARNVERAKKHKSDDQGQALPAPKKLRSSLESFLWSEECFICGQIAQNDMRHPDRNPVFEVRTIEMRETILQACDRSDNWSRVQGCAFLVAAEARYHHKCFILFSKGRRPENTPIESLAGRPVNQTMHRWFLRLCEWLENSSEVELYTVDDLMAKMEEIAGGEETYTSRTLREKLIQRYDEHVFFAKIGGGQKDVLCFRNMADYIVHRKWHDEKIENREAEIRRIIITCARLVKEEIREREYSRDYYPSLNDIRDVEKGREFLTPCLQLLMEHLIPCSLRRDCIGQMITQAAKPKTVISPLMFGLGLEMDHVFGSSCAGIIYYPIPTTRRNYPPIRDPTVIILQQHSMEMRTEAQRSKFQSPNDDSGIYSALVYLQTQGEKLGLQNFCITFDQPLYLRASEIVEAKKMNKIVLRLGGFHLLMSALGSLYHLMAGSGMEEML
ncbi:hypothetical protein LOTGIDRAFT_154963 [Lottia gigantea]|uniref:Uncharacterized protein n=1 Tax=Lottia gigantea TaxID=225164 RepID=V3ZME2_LOTGI|nr:hypothetical protein LOTGIDRAFT_154963 [Lottia gigantea]ESO85472.1 hypothetical protein LOTGIDRAFT_154963 [Lottia gigantea]